MVARCWAGVVAAAKKRVKPPPGAMAIARRERRKAEGTTAAIRCNDAGDRSRRESSRGGSASICQIQSEASAVGGAARAVTSSTCLQATTLSTRSSNAMMGQFSPFFACTAASAHTNPRRTLV